MKFVAIITATLGLALGGFAFATEKGQPPLQETASANVESQVLVIPAEQFRLVSSRGVVEVSTDSAIVVATGRPQDVVAWATSVDSSVLGGLEAWDTLALRRSGSTSSVGDSVAGLDIWYTVISAEGPYVLQIADAPTDVSTVVITTDGTDIGNLTVTWDRVVDKSWYVPTLVFSGLLFLVGLAMYILRVLDLRPVQSKLEEKQASMKKLASGDRGAVPGSRRKRREDGKYLPKVDLTAIERDSSEAVPEGDGAAEDTSDTPSAEEEPRS